jgi:hypothetical protein
LLKDIANRAETMAYQQTGIELAAPTKRQQLEHAKAVLEARLAKITAAITALDNHPELENFINVINAAEF